VRHEHFGCGCRQFSGGWIADNIMRPVFGDYAAREADKVHEQIGKPLDNVIPKVVGGAVNERTAEASESPAKASGLLHFHTLLDGRCQGQ